MILLSSMPHIFGFLALITTLKISRRLANTSNCHWSLTRTISGSWCLKVLVSWVLISVNLHARHVLLLWCGSCVHLDETLQINIFSEKKLYKKIFYNYMDLENYCSREKESQCKRFKYMSMSENQSARWITTCPVR